MGILAIDTSCLRGSAALVIPDRNIRDRIFFSREHPASETLLPAIQTLLTRNNQDPRSLKGLAVAMGPGSFTGLRVGLTAAKTMAYFLQLPLTGVPTLDILAHAASTTCLRIAALVDARKGEIYAAYYWREGNTLHRDSDYLLGPPDRVLRNQDPLYVMGDALERYHDVILSILPRESRVSPETEWYLDACRLADMALSGDYPAWSGETLFKLAPMYIRPPEAELKWKGP